MSRDLPAERAVNSDREAPDASVTSADVSQADRTDSVPSTAIFHGRCGKWWTGTTRGHCGACHDTFTAGAFDKHQRLDHGVVICSTAKLYPRDEPWGTLWTTSAPGTGAAVWAARRAAETDGQE